MIEMENRKDKSMFSIISPEMFCSTESEKTKLNWFCYELSMAIYDKIKEMLGKEMIEYGIDDEAIAEFSVYLSKEAKTMILQRLSREIDNICFSYESVILFFPQLSDKLIDDMLDAILEAWDKHLSICEICPTRCISEKDRYCTMFDDEDYKRL